MKLDQFRSATLFALLCLLCLGLSGCSVAGASEDEIQEAWAGSPHADIESQAFTNWDDRDPPEISENCAGCHSTPGYQDFLGLDGSTPEQVDHPAPIGTTIECEACHNDAAESKKSSTMPSGVEISAPSQEAVCMDCHQGRASGLDVAEATQDLDLDEVNRGLELPNLHSNAAAPILLGSEATGGYQYEGRSYAGRYEHVPQFNDCTGCHDAHTLKLAPQKCSACHVRTHSTARMRAIRTSAADYDGDGDTQEGISGEIRTLQERLLLAMQQYAVVAEDVDPIVYKRNERPYFFKESGDDYTTWTPRLLRAAYNYHFVEKSWGHFAHNPTYTIQLLYDSLDSFETTYGMTRP
jgi:hypothetical protein